MTEIRTYATGRRKTSVARVWLSPGTGEIKVNGKTLMEHFGREALKMIIEQPFEAVSLVDQYDVFTTVKGGGLTGQAGAIRLGIARALKEINPENTSVLRERGMLTRDPREKERKKYGLSGRRRRFQYSKR